MSAFARLAGGLVAALHLTLVACAPEADFKGITDTVVADTLTPDLADSSEDTGVDSAPEGETEAPAACAEDSDCEARWADVVIACHRPACSDEGQCEWLPLDDDTGCDDGNDCTEDDACLGGQCVGEPLICDQGVDPCVRGVCVRGEGCVTSNTSAPCDDGDACTIGDRCDKGSCKAGTPLDCDDANPCTADACQQGACSHQSLDDEPCDDGNPCTIGERCDQGLCLAGAWNDCADLPAQPCQVAACDPAQGGCGWTPLPDDAACDDGNACTGQDTCLMGNCIGMIATDCDDGDPCTIDLCDAGSGCTHNAANPGSECDDGNPCTEGDACGAQGCVGQPTLCQDADPCTVNYCDPLGGGCVAEPLAGLPCDDGNLCTLADACDAQGVCRPGPTKECNDNNACTNDSCTVSAGKAVCAFTPVSGLKACNDGNPCTNPGGSNNDLCVPGKGVCGGTQRDCDDGDACTRDMCDPLSGECVYALEPDDTECPTPDACAVEDSATCQAGVCRGEAIDCDDHDRCTADSCDPVAGCQHQTDFDPSQADCARTGVCAEGVEVDCQADTWICTYGGVVGYEEGDEVSCDGLDNDCDGRTDEGLCAVCSAGQAFCDGDSVYRCNATGFGWDFERVCPVDTACMGEGLCLPPDAPVRIAQDLDPSAARSHHAAAGYLGGLFVAYPALDDDAPIMKVARATPEDGALAPISSLPDAEVLGVLTRDGRSVVVAHRMASSSTNLDVTLTRVQGEQVLDTLTHPVAGFQALGAPLLLGDDVVALPFATSDEAGQSLRLDRVDLGGAPAQTMGSWPTPALTVKRVALTRQVDGDLVTLFATNEPATYLTRFSFGAGAFSEPTADENGLSYLALASATAAPFTVIARRNPNGGELVAELRATDDFGVLAEADLGLFGNTVVVRAFPAGAQVVVAAEEGGVLTLWRVAFDATTSALVGAPDAGFDLRYGRAPGGVEWFTWRTPAGELWARFAMAP